MSLNVLVLGWIGFIGRNFVSYLVKNNLAASIRVVDKFLPETAYLTASQKEEFYDARVEFKQANLVNAGMRSNLFNAHCDSIGWKSVHEGRWERIWPSL